MNSHAVTSAPRAEAGPFERRVLRSLLDTSLLWLVLLATLVETGFVLLSPWLSAEALDRALPEQAPHLLCVLALFVVVTAGHAAACGLLRDRLLVVVQHRCEAQSLEHLVDHVLSADFTTAQQRTFGDIQETMRAASEVCRALCALLMGGVTQLSTAAAALAVLCCVFPGLGVSAGLVALFLVLCSALLARREAGFARARLAASSAQKQFIHVLLGGVAQVRIAGATLRLFAGWSRLVKRQARLELEEHRQRVHRKVLLQALPRLLAVLALTWLVTRVLTGSATLGEMLMATLLCSSFFASATAVIDASLGFAALEPQRMRVNQALRAEVLQARRPAPAYALDPELGIELDDVWFRYREAGPWVLQAKTQTFPAGNVSVIRAHSGFGKSTLLRLVAGLQRPARGRVRVFGVDPACVSGLVSYLPQRTLLLKGTIATNLTTLSGAPLSAALEIAHLTGLDSLLRQLPLGLETPTQTGSGSLSAGQRQVVLLTALFAAGRPVVLIDEGLSQVDEGLRRQVDWHGLSQGRTILFVSHE